MILKNKLLLFNINFHTLYPQTLMKHICESIKDIEDIAQKIKNNICFL